MPGTIARWWAHLRHGASSARRAFPDAALARIEQAIERSEREHTAELRFAIEASLPIDDVRRGRSPRERALEVFANTGVWDTEANNGVLLYVLLADHAVEIVADRAAAARIADAYWREICAALSDAYRRGEFEAGTAAAIERIGRLLAAAFPRSAGTADADELPNRPLLL
ncbi:MAG: TPM domain-containing protein [Burkholderiaceae bacterium]|nr:TPM domain-containing protein [Burkholderiaceae bacterium]